MTSAMSPSDYDRACAVLSVDLDALADNWRLYRDTVGPTCQAAAVVKAAAYGLDARRIAPALKAAGCRLFFVAHLDEAVALRQTLGRDVEIAVLNGLMAKCESVFAEHDLIPVLNDPGSVAAWRAFARRLESPYPAMIHLDTGMSRLGFSPAETQALIDDPTALDGIDVRAVISHLACADEPDHPLNVRQLATFGAALDALGRAPSHSHGVDRRPAASLANSSGVFLGSRYHFDFVRPGAALYGVNPTPHAPNPMAQVVRLQGKILQIRTIDTPLSVGYGATVEPSIGSRIATVGVGYADGYPRSLSNGATAYLGDHAVTVVGRVSMDLITIDVTRVPPALLHPGALVDLIGPHNPVDAVAHQAGTIGYEILTGLGSRFHRVYIEKGGAHAFGPASAHARGADA
ncbi:alanine racemase [Varunaivibrio sulfuroxidans]|uniref:Alanine racemase n=1 Tax=Varunaivibrio sulfuroxidans TaxID=1773489 RepID=A0A4R3J4G5_9PROT|nr:alanine racemase [Varunaivibrio sulfuroxidans]TCS60135.1 alanine racemase [Varunaivibrio sulfuroxidans]WES30893.1 alanine racemase [Varunaivibrio sulfuroxidans]